MYFSTGSIQTATRAPALLSTSVAFKTSIAVAGPGFTANTQPATATTSTSSPGATKFITSASTVGALPVNSNGPTSVPTTQTSNNSISGGAIAGVVVGGIIVVLLAFLAIVFLRCQRRKKASKLPSETTTVHEVESNGRKSPDTETDVIPMTTSSVLFTPELSAEQTTYAASYEKRPIVLEERADSRYGSYPLSPPDPSAHELSPSANTEMATVAPSEAAASTRAPPDYGPSHHGIAEADSAHQSHIVSPHVHELGNTSFQHELSTSPYVTSSPPIPAQSAFTAHELSSSPAPRPAATLSAPHTSLAPVGKAVTGDKEAEDLELKRMKAEIEAVRAEKERVKQLQALEERERELSRKIVNRELSRGGS